MDFNANNMVINGYSGVWAYDHDDCSQFVLDHDSFMVFGGEWKVLCVPSPFSSPAHNLPPSLFTPPNTHFQAAKTILETQNPATPMLSCTLA